MGGSWDNHTGEDFDTIADVDALFRMCRSETDICKDIRWTARAHNKCHARGHIAVKLGMHVGMYTRLLLQPYKWIETETLPWIQFEM